MKNQLKHVLFTLVFLFISFGSFAQQPAKKDTSIIEKAKISVKTGIHQIDTSSNFRLVYTDLKEGVAALAGALKVGAEHVYIVIVKQQIVVSITNTIGYLIILTALYCCYKLIKKAESLGNYKEGYLTHSYLNRWQFVVAAIAGSLLLIIFAFYLGNTLTDTVMGYINPEFGAIKQVVQIVQDIKNK